MASEDRPNYKIAIAEIFPEISGEHLRPQLIAAIKTSPLAVEQVLLSAKIDIIIAHLKWTDKKQELLDLIASLGFTVVKEQTGDRFLYINATEPLITLI
jgi:hypothetical protein